MLWGIVSRYAQGDCISPLVHMDIQGLAWARLERDGVVCVHPVQIYLDLKKQPERAKEAADHLRAELLKWSANG